MSNQRIAIIDYGMGNLHSAASALEHVAADAEVVITSDKAIIESADRVVFPGVGAIRDCMHEIKRLEFDTLIRKQVEDKPVLAICVGMQALMNHSEENDGVDCIGLVDGNVHFFGNDLRDESQDSLKVPHMGWNQLEIPAEAHPVLAGMGQDPHVYFVHSYHLQPREPERVLARVDYGGSVTAVVGRDNLVGTQFHPEKSQAAGLKLLENFLKWTP